MKKLGILVLLLSAAAAIQAQDKKSLFTCMAQKNILSHMDIGVNVGTVGVGIDVAVPVTNYVRIRAGYNYMPRFTIHSNFPIETSHGDAVKYLEKIKSVDLEKKAAEVGIDLNLPEFKEYKDMSNKFRNVEAKDYVTMNLKPNLSQFKFFVDVIPFKNNRHWSFTAGIFVGSYNIGEACNHDKETLLLEAVTAYNNLYIDYLRNGRSLAGHGEVDKLTELFTENGIAGFPLGYFEDGKKAMMIPNKDGTVSTELKVNKVRPYVGIGYNTSLSRNKRWKLNVDAGVLIRCGKPHIYVDNVYKIDNTALVGYYDDDYNYHHVSGIGFNKDDDYYGDIVRPNLELTDYVVDEPLQHVDLLIDLNSIPGKVGDMTRLISKFKVYPNLSVTVSYRLF